MKKPVVALLFLVVVVCLYLFTPARQYLSPEGLMDLKEWILSSGPWAPVVFILVYVGATLFALPGSILTLAAGALFGPWLGTVYVIIASNLGANGAFCIARYLGQDVAAGFLRGNLPTLGSGLEKNGFYVILGLRLLPAIPFNVLNYAGGLSPLKWKDYALGTFLGMIPATFAYVSLGNVVNAVEGGSIWSLDTLSRPQVWGPFALVIALSLIPKFVKKKG